LLKEERFNFFIILWFNLILSIAPWFGENCGESLKEKLQKLQNRAARVITGDTYDVRSKDILKKLNWKNLSVKRKSLSLYFCLFSF
jgi:hypothetical protein